MTKLRRSKKLAHPKLQLRVASELCGLATLVLALQFLLFGNRLAAALSRVDPGNGELLEIVPGVLVEVLVYSLLLVLPALFAIGILITFRIAGPLYRFERFLDAVARGEQAEPCRLRENDALQELCEKINVATSGLRERTGAETERGAA